MKSASSEICPEILNCWAGYFEQLHKADSAVREPVIRNVPAVVVDSLASCDLPDLEEISVAVKQLLPFSASRPIFPRVAGMLLFWLSLQYAPVSG